MSKLIYINARFLTQKTTGVQRFAIEISKHLKNIYSEVVFLAPPNIISKELAKELNVISFGIFKGHLWEQIELPLYLKSKGNPILINLCNTAPLYYNNQIVTIHDLAFMVNPKWFSKKFAFAYKFLIPKVAKKAKHIITVSNSSKSEISELLSLPFNKISVVYNGITFINEDIQHAAPLLNDKYFLTVSSIDPRKNLQNLIDAFQKWNTSNTKLLVIGGKNASFAYKDVYGVNNNVKYLGYVSDKELINYYKNALCFVYPSLYEGFGLPPLEALALGTNVIVSDIPSVREVCKDFALKYFDPTSTDSIVNALEYAFKNEKSVAHIDLEEFSWSKSADKLKDILIKYNI